MKKVLPYLVFASVILAAGWAVYEFGYKNGSNDVRLKWEENKAAFRSAQDVLVAQMAKLEETHKLKQEGVSRDLAKVHKDHEATLRNLRANYDQRLLQSANRADMYQRQAETGAAACGDLASHAAQLDRSLEEGRGLVTELGTTLGLREQQLRQLGIQLSNDRQLFTGAGER